MPLKFCRLHAPELLIAFFALIILAAAFGDVGGEAGAFLTSALDVALFVILAMLVYLAGTRHPAFRWAAILWLLVLVAGLAAVAAGFGVIAILPAEALGAGEIDPETVDLDLAAGVALLLLGVLAVGAASLIGFSRRFRGWLAGYLPFDPDSLLHTVALVVILAMILIPPVPLLAAGVPPFLSEPFLDLLLESGDLLAETVTLNAYTLFWTLIGSFFIAGACVRRTGRETLERLGLVRPTGKQIVLAVAAALALVAAFHFIDPVLAALVGWLGLPVTDMEAVNLLFAGTLTLPGIVVASIAAGFGEEVSIRGLLQPRFGILLPALLFASLHAFQYSWDGLISVFLAGIIFAYIRRYTNTTTSAITHTVYDLVLFSMMLIGMSI
ncbi:CPBP family intramembrane metalloprotease [Methanoculleus sp. YWC-01]|jgi:membrane protease YdiL (CAAX protease family)|uniref:CPBP family intramembrane metalloprotease n=1 Tax=Methanoculleus nereidis TaxID=2735141 RepID=A0ABU3Z0F5_9EURY|nr:CPBP family intramembrane glutamic endopeptidase [Methanoculleus sp. YWC-01]MCK9299108.1 CPBP family intramembrane metalloprotease [Methanoculleus sp.]MDV4342297.1 CPBP family intramembrane metalloprotease [Methanoculleus sp. YWC-01]PKL57092.1 MAG: CPBP family intramembrane metalloprotease domain-containing protein [Methanomicrobiales archaeon HGW-Methanomicrobiales-6]